MIRDHLPWIWSKPLLLADRQCWLSIAVHLAFFLFCFLNVSLSISFHLVAFVTCSIYCSYGVYTLCAYIIIIITIDATWSGTGTRGPGKWDPVCSLPPLLFSINFSDFLRNGQSRWTSVRLRHYYDKSWNSCRIYLYDIHETSSERRQTMETSSVDPVTLKLHISESKLWFVRSYTIFVRSFIFCSIGNKCIFRLFATMLI